MLLPAHAVFTALLASCTVALAASSWTQNAARHGNNIKKPSTNMEAFQMGLGPLKPKLRSELRLPGSRTDGL
jgi:hypothetical protein